MRSESPSLLPIFRSRHQAELLALLLLHPDEEFTLTGLSRRLRTPLTTLQREVARLVEAGLVQQRRLGRTRLLSAASANRYAEPLTQLVTLAFGPHLVVEEEFRELDGVDAVIIYGSWAARYQGEAGPPPNDVDVLVIGQTNRTEVYEAADRAERRLGLPVNPSLRTRTRWLEASDALVRQVRSSPVVWVIDKANLREDA
jgi:predicted nucleotidyltransferase